MRHHLEADRLASSLFLFSPDEAYEIALDFMNGALVAQDREGAMVWTAALAIIEQMQSDYQYEPGFIPETRSGAMM